MGESSKGRSFGKDDPRQAGELLGAAAADLAKGSAIDPQGALPPDRGSAAKTPVTSRSKSNSPSRSVEKLPQEQIPGYRLARKLAAGGQAVVYEATQVSTGRRVAVKILSGGGFVSAKVRGRFEREVQILASLRHPNIVAIIDRGKTADGSLFLVMDLIGGQQLDTYLDQYYRSHPEGPPPEDPSELLRLFLKICEAVNAAHVRGVIHRDLKPSNIRVDERNEPHVLDFGLARPALPPSTAGEEGLPMTIVGQFLGSLPWASPEQANGQTDDLDVRTDVYSLGVILYQMLTGRFPYAVAGTMRDVLNNIITAQPMPPSKINSRINSKISSKSSSAAARFALIFRGKIKPIGSLHPAVEAIVMKALAKSRDDRYQSAGDLARDVQNYLAGRMTEARSEPQRRSVSVPLMAAVVVVPVLAGALLVGWMKSRPSASASAAASSAVAPAPVTTTATQPMVLAATSPALQANAPAAASPVLPASASPAPLVVAPTLPIMPTPPAPAAAPTVVIPTATPTADISAVAAEIAALPRAPFRLRVSADGMLHIKLPPLAPDSKQTGPFEFSIDDDQIEMSSGDVTQSISLAAIKSVHIDGVTWNRRIALRADGGRPTFIDAGANVDGVVLQPIDTAGPLDEITGGVTVHAKGGAMLIMDEGKASHEWLFTPTTVTRGSLKIDYTGLSGISTQLDRGDSTTIDIEGTSEAYLGFYGHEEPVKIRLCPDSKNLKTIQNYVNFLGASEISVYDQSDRSEDVQYAFDFEHLTVDGVNVLTFGSYAGQPTTNAVELFCAPSTANVSVSAVVATNHLTVHADPAVKVNLDPSIKGGVKVEPYTDQAKPAGK